MVLDGIADGIHGIDWYSKAFLEILSNFGAGNSLAYRQIEQAFVRPSLKKLLGVVTISRRSAAGSCTDANTASAS